MPRHRKKIIDIGSAIVLLALVALDAALWQNIFARSILVRADAPTEHIEFLPVTQGESALLVLDNGVTILTDAGSDAAIVDDLAHAMPASAPAYIDLAIISYPQPADYAGYQYLLAHYAVGAFLYNGRADTANKTEWQAFTSLITQKKIPLIMVGAGDSIRYGPDTMITVLSPDATFAKSPDPTDTGVVQLVKTPRFGALLLADVGANIISGLLAPDGRDLRANILKASFPGVDGTVGEALLRAIAPQNIVITPGVKNTPSAPTKAELAHLASSTHATTAVSGHGLFLLYNK